LFVLALFADIKVRQRVQRKGVGLADLALVDAVPIAGALLLCVF
jgi:hypothetical protein